MKLQVAIDRVPLQRAVEIVEMVQDSADIIEIGTSLIKDYGMESVRAVRNMLDGKMNGGGRPSRPQILADIKAMDEGAYEFEATYTAGADFATVMGAAARGTVEACYRVAENRQRDILIDLLETSPEKINALQAFEHALFCIHLPKDGPADDIVAKVTSFCTNYPNVKRIAVAGGVRLEQISLLAKLPIEVCIVGSAITGAEDPSALAREFADVIRNARA